MINSNKNEWTTDTVATWMNLKIIMLSIWSYTKRVIPLTGSSRKYTLMCNDRKQTRDWGEWGNKPGWEEGISKGPETFLGWYVLYLDSGDSFTYVYNVLKLINLCALNMCSLMLPRSSTANLLPFALSWPNFNKASFFGLGPWILLVPSPAPLHTKGGKCPPCQLLLEISGPQKNTFLLVLTGHYLLLLGDPLPLSAYLCSPLPLPC